MATVAAGGSRALAASSVTLRQYDGRLPMSWEDPRECLGPEPETAPCGHGFEPF
jgi:hypothetical protein